MPHRSHVVRASILRGFDQFLEKRGIAPEALLEQAGMRAADLSDSERDLPFNSVARLMENAALACGDASLGISFAKAFPVGGTGVLGFLFLNSKTIGDAMQTLARFVPLLRAPHSFTFETEEGGACLTWRPPDDVPTSFVQFNTFVAALIVLRLRQVIRPDWRPRSVELQTAPLADTSQAAGLFGANVTYFAPRNAIHVDAATLEQPLAEAEPELRAVLERYGEKMMAELPPPESGLIEQTKSAILRLLGGGRTALEDVAAYLDCSPRTLQSRLATHSTTFEEILNDVRKTRAEQLLRKPDTTLTEIAYQLGFSELSSFTRAAQRWFGRTPSAQRQRLLTELH